MKLDIAFCQTGCEKIVLTIPANPTFDDVIAAFNRHCKCNLLRKDLVEVSTLPTGDSFNKEYVLQSADDADEVYGSLTVVLKSAESEVVDIMQLRNRRLHQFVSKRKFLSILMLPSNEIDLSWMVGFPPISLKDVLDGELEDHVNVSDHICICYYRNEVRAGDPKPGIKLYLDPEFTECPPTKTMFLSNLFYCINGEGKIQVVRDIREHTARIFTEQEYLEKNHAARVQNMELARIGTC